MIHISQFQTNCPNIRLFHSALVKMKHAVHGVIAKSGLMALWPNDLVALWPYINKFGN